MRSLQSLLFTLCTALMCVSSAAAVIHVFGYEGRDVNVSCPYDRGYESYEKYLCKNDCGNGDVLITTSQTNKNKYSIYDDTRSRIFTATISDLRSVDAGTYWCGVTRTGKDIYTEVKLQIIQDSCCDSVTKIQSHEEGSVSISCPYESQYQNNLKYMCRGKRPSTCLQQAVITSDNTHNAQFTLTDDKESRKFTVTVSSLTLNDSGSYLCGVHRNNGLDVFSAVELEVKDWCCVKSDKTRGVVGHAVALRCPYPPQHLHNRKFLCKGDHRNNCTDMVTSQSRFMLQDDVSSRSFTVTITQLEAGDAGTYWCGSDSQWSVGNYTKIQLSVAPQSRKKDPAPSTSHEPTSPQWAVSEPEPGASSDEGIAHVSMEGTAAVFPQPTNISTTTGKTAETNSTRLFGKPIAGATLFVVLSVLAVLLVMISALVIAFKHKRSKAQGAGVVTNGNTSEEEDAEGVTGGADIYANKEVVMFSKQRTSNQQSPCHLYDDAGDDQPDYENFTAAEDIYCNQNYHKSNKK